MKRLVQIVILLVGVVIGTREALEMRASLKWPSTEGQIISSSISEHTYKRYPDSTNTCCKYELLVRYRYEVDGMMLEGNRLRVRPDRLTARRLVERQQAEYTVGARVKVYYDPEQPDRAVLIRH